MGDREKARAGHAPLRGSDTPTRCSEEDWSLRRLALCLAWDGHGKVNASAGFPAVLGTRGEGALIGWRPARHKLPKIWEGKGDPSPLALVFAFLAYVFFPPARGL